MSNNPWRTMWVDPRATIQSIVIQNPKRSLWVLAFIYGFTSLLNCFQSFPIAIQFGIVPMLLIAMIAAPIWGYVFFSIWSWVIFRVGRLLNGEANFQMVRAAYAWSCVPLMGNILLWFVLVMFFADFLFFGMQDQIVLPAYIIMLFVLLIGKLVFAIWAVVIFLQALAQVQQFTIMRAIANVVLAALFVGLATAAIWTIAFYALSSVYPPAAAVLNLNY